MKKQKIPNQIFVTSKIEEERIFNKVDGVWDYNNPIIEKHNFGFLHAHEPGTSSDASRKETQIGWAYSGMSVYNRGDDAIYWQRGRKFDYTSRQYYEIDEQIEFEVAPKIWDNVPLSGFKIIDTVNRYRGNKLFKVLDPRGIEFEITAKSLFEIVTEGKIESGEILSKCVWQRGKHLIVVK